MGDNMKIFSKIISFLSTIITITTFIKQIVSDGDIYTNIIAFIFVVIGIVIVIVIENKGETIKHHTVLYCVGVFFCVIAVIIPLMAGKGSTPPKPLNSPQATLNSEPIVSTQAPITSPLVKNTTKPSHDAIVLNMLKEHAGTVNLEKIYDSMHSLQSFKGYLGKKDIKKYEFEIPANGGILSIDFEHDIESEYVGTKGTSITIYNANRDVLYRKSYENPKNSITTTPIGLNQGVYSLELESTYSLSGWNYTLDLKFLPTTNCETEPNNMINVDNNYADDIILTENGITEIYGSYQDDDTSKNPDYYKVHIPQDGCIAFSINHRSLTGSSNAFHITVLDENQVKIIEFASERTVIDTESKPLQISQGDYYIKVDGHVKGEVYLLNIAYQY